MAYRKRYEDHDLDRDEQEFEEASQMNSAGMEAAARSYKERGEAKKAAAFWVKLMEIAERTGNKELYYRAMEEL